MTTYKLVLLGGGGVGKSSIVLQFVKRTFFEDYDPTIEDSYVHETCVDGKPYVLDVLDTGGAINTNQDHHIQEGDVFMIVYSVTDPNSFKDVKIYWEKILIIKKYVRCPILLIANKVDLVNTRIISKTDGRAMARQLQVPYVETSAHHPPKNVDRAFHKAIRAIRNQYKENEDSRCHVQ